MVTCMVVMVMKPLEMVVGVLLNYVIAVHFVMDVHTESGVLLRTVSSPAGCTEGRTWQGLQWCPYSGGVGTWSQGSCCPQSEPSS